MRKLSLWKRIKLFRYYRKTIKSNKAVLLDKFNLRVDNAQRIYTVINIPIDKLGEAFTIKKSDITRVSEAYIREFYEEVSVELNKMGLLELYNLYKVERIDRTSYLVVIGYSQFNSVKYYNNIYYKLIPFLILLGFVVNFLLKKNII